MAWLEDGVLSKWSTNATSKTTGGKVKQYFGLYFEGIKIIGPFKGVDSV